MVETERIYIDIFIDNRLCSSKEMFVYSKYITGFRYKFFEYEIDDKLDYYDMSIEYLEDYRKFKYKEDIMATVYFIDKKQCKLYRYIIESYTACINGEIVELNYELDKVIDIDSNTADSLTKLNNKLKTEELEKHFNN